MRPIGAAGAVCPGEKEDTYVSFPDGDAGAHQRRDPAARSKLEIFLLYQGVHATCITVWPHWLYCHNWKF